VDTLAPAPAGGNVHKSRSSSDLIREFSHRSGDTLAMVQEEFSQSAARPELIFMAASGTHQIAQG
jgi:hypothetical protein